jgi:hypothetical protein
MIVKPYPKDNEARTFGVRERWLDAIAEHISSRGLGRDELLFATEPRTPISRNTFRTRVWLPAVRASGLDFNVRMHDLRTCVLAARRRRGPKGRYGTDGPRADPDNSEVSSHAYSDKKNIDAFSRIANRRSGRAGTS